MNSTELNEILVIIFETEPELIDKGLKASWWETFQDEDYSIARRAALKIIDADIMGKPKRSDFKKMLKVVRDEDKRKGQVKNRGTTPPPPLPVPTLDELHELRDNALTWLEWKIEDCRDKVNNKPKLAIDMEGILKRNWDDIFYDYAVLLEKSLVLVRVPLLKFLETTEARNAPRDDRKEPDIVYFDAVRRYLGVEKYQPQYERFVWRDIHGEVGERSQRFCYRTSVFVGSNPGQGE